MNQTICFGRTTTIQYTPETMQFHIYTASGDFATKEGFEPSFETCLNPSTCESAMQGVNSSSCSRSPVQLISTFIPLNPDANQVL